MINPVRPRLVTFDVTGTLLMTKLEHYIEIGSQHGLLVEPRKLAQSFKTNFVQLSKEHPIYGKHTGLGWRNWWKTIVHNVFREQHASVSTDTLDKKRNVILGVISNFDQRLESILEEVQIRQYFAFVLTSYDFGMEKPSLSIFEEALRLVKHFREEEILPEEAIHIGDRVDNDYFGAKSAGWNALLIKHDNEINESKVPRKDVFKSLDELQRHFENI
ncbi:rhythmically expressed gene 2 protein isoform X2 [Monomorium pharaonis]|uniref:rhythmically expressed gene 2 protein isoform X2 n=1 Tax=Monomorium pharaonis TaxID=307658 RepID=UPI00102E13AD|nr:rhythmically expressed gene 2 protein isoform X2 [Monomorium pharaonis]